MDRKKIYTDIPKRTRNAILARINATVKKYGYEEFRMVAIRLFNENKEKEKLEKEISEREEELRKLKSKK